MEHGLDKDVYRDMLELQILFLNNADFRNFLRNSVVKPSQKRRILGILFQDSLSNLTLEFLKLVLRKARMDNVEGIIIAYVQLFRKAHRMQTITVFTARELSEKQKTELQSGLNQQLPEDIVELRCEVRPYLIGGFLLRFGDYRYDDTIYRRIENLRREFEENYYESKF
jgi:F-type H+-transporting ATPase subunit delta